MVNNFFEKLKKGMNIEDAAEPEKETEEIQEENHEEPKIEEDGSKIEAEFQVIGAEDIKPEVPKKFKEVVLTSKKITKEKKSKKEKIKIKQESILNRDETEEETAIFEKQGQLTIDVFETNKNIVIQSAVGGVNPEDLDIIIEKDMVCINGRRKRCEEEETERFFFQECYWGKFSREIILPVLVDSSKSQASLENGVLTIKIPKTENQDNSQKINIKAL